MVEIGRGRTLVWSRLRRTAVGHSIRIDYRPRARAMPSDERLSLLLDTLAQVVISVELQPTLQILVDGLHTLVPFDAGGIFVRQAEQHVVRARAARGYPGDMEMPASEGIVGEVIRSVRSRHPRRYFLRIGSRIGIRRSGSRACDAIRAAGDHCDRARLTARTTHATIASQSRNRDRGRDPQESDAGGRAGAPRRSDIWAIAD